MTDVAIMRGWITRRRRQRLEGAAPRTVIEFVPGAENGQRAYFWIGNENKHYATIDARELASWMETLRRDA